MAIELARMSELDSVAKIPARLPTTVDFEALPDGRHLVGSVDTLESIGLARSTNLYGILEKYTWGSQGAAFLWPRAGGAAFYRRAYTSSTWGGWETVHA